MGIISIPAPTGEPTEDRGEITLTDERAFMLQKSFRENATLSDTCGVTVIRIPERDVKNGVFFVKSEEPIESWTGCGVKANGTDCKNRLIYEITPMSQTMRFDHI